MRLAPAALFLAGILPAQSTIDGRVVNSVTRGGIEGVSVEFYTQKGVRYETVTASDGSFHIAGVELGIYRHSIEKEGFEPPPRPEIPAPEPATQVNGKNPVQVVFEMTAWTTLRGRVVDDDGKPAAGVPVQIRGPVSPREDNQIPTASDGTFQFNHLPPGEYKLGN
jgi:Carboxypeptidase regulatory-like domain